MKSAFTRHPNNNKSPFVGLKKQSDLVSEANKVNMYESLPANRDDFKSQTFSYEAKSRV